MGSTNSLGISVGDFAQSLFEQEIANPTPKPKRSNLPGNVPDISDVEVIQESVDNVLSNSFGISKPLKPEVNLEEERQLKLKEEVLATISKLKKLLSEMSLGTTGSGKGSGILTNPNFSNVFNKSNKKAKRRRSGRKKV